MPRCDCNAACGHPVRCGWPSDVGGDSFADYGPPAIAIAVLAARSVNSASLPAAATKIQSAHMNSDCLPRVEALAALVIVTMRAVRRFGRPALTRISGTTRTIFIGFVKMFGWRGSLRAQIQAGLEVVRAPSV
jgi:hypothetical protein